MQGFTPTFARQRDFGRTLWQDHQLGLAGAAAHSVDRPRDGGSNIVKNTFKVLPNIEQLIQALQTQLLCAAKYRDRVVWKLLEQQDYRSSVRLGRVSGCQRVGRDTKRSP